MFIKVVIEIKPDYVCNACGKIKEGITTFTEVCNSYAEVTKFLLLMKTNPPQSGRPLGWVNGLQGSNCGCRLK